MLLNHMSLVWLETYYETRPKASRKWLKVYK